jgi:hypothetical protein
MADRRIEFECTLATAKVVRSNSFEYARTNKANK